MGRKGGSRADNGVSSRADQLMDMPREELDGGEKLEDLESDVEPPKPKVLPRVYSVDRTTLQCEVARLRHHRRGSLRNMRSSATISGISAPLRLSNGGRDRARGSVPHQIEAPPPRFLKPDDRFGPFTSMDTKGSSLSPGRLRP